MSRPLVPDGEELLTAATGSEPPVPRAFLWDERRLVVAGVLRRWRTSKNDRGDTYLKRHWFELESADGARLEVYFDRDARRGSSHWWLYTIDE
ncbi:MAG: hypothetical protein JO030_04825 [Candidatus Eremiobacteraeota bacterium]|nr:hypothetical protein [Candidatus Eremiobacteraeota bacterium]